MVAFKKKKRNIFGYKNRVKQILIFSLIFNWKLLALQLCVGFCCTPAWISYKYTCPLPPEPASPPTILQLVTLHFLCPSFYLTSPSPVSEQHFPERGQCLLCTTTSEGSFAELKIKSLITLLCWWFFIKYQSFSCLLSLSQKKKCCGE